MSSGPAGGGPSDSGPGGSHALDHAAAHDGCLVAVDLGNSAAKLIIRDTKTHPAKSFRIDRPDWTEQAIRWVQAQTQGAAVPWRIASVHRCAAVQLRSAVQAATPSARIRLISRHDVPIPLDVEFPDRVGIDRILSAFAAQAALGSPIVVVDAGSAVTVDYVDANGHFCGGAIMPGLHLQTNSLATGTDALPDLDWQRETTLTIPGRNTLQAIRLGVLTSVAAGIDRLAEQYRSQHREQYREQSKPEPSGTVVVTGGDASVLSPQLQCPHVVEPNLVCRGLVLLPETPEPSQAP